MSASKNTGRDISEQQDAEGADIKRQGEAIEVQILGLLQALQDAKGKNGTVPAAAAKVLENIRAGLELLNSAVEGDAPSKEVHFVKAAAHALLNHNPSEPVPDKVNYEFQPATEESESAELTEKEIDAWDAQVQQGVESLGNVPACVQNMVDPGRRNADAYSRLQTGAYELAEKSGVLPFILCGGQMNQGETQRNDLRLLLISSITMASDLLADVRGLRGGKRLHDGFMHDKAGYAAARNLSNAITQLYPVLEELGIPQAQCASLKEMCDEAATVKLMISMEEKSAIIKGGLKANDFSGSSDARRRRLA